MSSQWVLFASERKYQKKALQRDKENRNGWRIRVKTENGYTYGHCAFYCILTKIDR